ncbi:acyl-CoA thioesterase [Xinfangfangia sp. D13-10-4-6]|uniref:acyl-CoA thioesterase n=1 Tax=Pseudogemmobacter hezensis TaxID=2737662 RepID=UPI0015575A34|nr:thioesterase family protein [Pseudogemmobacter hezensis]NPD14832.1 acyl-CoA thioesterase [Pseudogemmobacter hezensis]
MTYTRPIRIEFNHCDPAGIVFYPRYFEMTNSVVENFFREIAGWPYEEMMAAGTGVPTAQIQTVFHAPSRLGEVLDWRLSLVRLGSSSASLHIEAHGAGIHRLTCDLTLVFVNENGRPQPWPQAVRTKLIAFQEAT